MSHSSGLQKLLDFMKSHALTMAGLHRGFEERYGRKRSPKYTTVVSWVKGVRKPSEGHRKMLLECCGIPEEAWLSPEEIRQMQWHGGLRSVVEKSL